MAVISAMLGVIFILVLHFTKMNLEKESLLMMQTIGSNPMFMEPPESNTDETAGLQLPYFTIQINPLGEMVAFGGSTYDLSDKAFLQELTDAAFASRSQNGIIPEYHLRYLHVIAPGPGGRCLVFADISGEQRTLNGLLQACLLIGLFCLLIFFVISIFLARWAVRPVEQAWEQQRQFVADASHDLKTPLTVILANAEMLQSEEFSAEDQKQFSGSILTMAHQMQGLVEGMLTLARTDRYDITQTFTCINLSDTLQHALLPFEPVFFEQQLGLDSHMEPEIFVNGSALYLEKLLDILLDNAAKYSIPGGKTTVSLTKAPGKHCLLAVSNPGEMLSVQDQKNIFQRFYRADEARSMNRSYGLGLSIAQNIVISHRGKIWCESSMNINTFFVRLPMC